MGSLEFSEHQQRQRREKEALECQNQELRGDRLSLKRIEEVYQELLGRGLSPEEKNLYPKGTDETVLLKSILKSEEFVSRLQFLSNGYVESNGRTEKELLMESMLGRPMRESEHALFDKIPLAEYIHILLTSDERASVEVKKRSTRIIENSIELKSSLMDFLIGRPIRDYEKELFQEQDIGEFVVDILDSSERASYTKELVPEDIIEPRFGATTYKVRWGKPATFTCVYNGLFQDSITEEIRRGRCGAWKEQYSFLRYFPDQGIFLDLGANVGLISCMLESRGWRGYAVEASPQNVRCLLKAIKLNDLAIEVGAFAVSDRSGTVRFLENGPWGQLETSFSNLEENICDKAYSGVSFVEIPSYALDDWELTGLSIPDEITYMKMDIEGSEIAAIQGMKKFLKKYGYPVIFCESNGEAQFYFGHTTEELRLEFEKIGLKRYRWENNRLIPCEKKEFQRHYCIDFLFMKEIPDYLCPYLVRSARRDDIDTQKRILEMLTTGIRAEKIHASSELKDFPEYLKNKEIYSALLGIKSGNDEILRKALAWFTEEDFCSG